MLIGNAFCKVPERAYQAFFYFGFRSELDDLPHNYSCDVIGLVTFVGRAERARKRGFSINTTFRIYLIVSKFLSKFLYTFLNVCLYRTQ